MFNGILVSTATGVGKESGKKWFKLSMIAETIQGNDSNVILENFCSETAYYEAQGIASMSRVKVACGVTETGKLCIHHIKEEA